jgi:hypothetical protein
MAEADPLVVEPRAAVEDMGGRGGGGEETAAQKPWQVSGAVVNSHDPHLIHGVPKDEQ